MWKLDQPKPTARYAYATCIARVRDRELRSRLESVKNEIGNAADTYAAAARQVAFHSLNKCDFELSRVSTFEMISIYQNRMAAKKSSGRVIYDEIIMAAPHGRCPLCGHRSVSTLDHYLPKTSFPALAVDPTNLIPSCADCNKLKKADVPTIYSQQTMHPYFDNIENDPWLYADVVEVTPPALRFYVHPPTEWTEDLALRVRRHFKTFHLPVLYASQAAQELNNINYGLLQLFTEGGEREVKRHLEDQSVSRRKAHVNSWQTATYTALSGSHWFCKGGFRQ